MSTPVEPGIYTIKSLYAPEYVLDLDAFGTANGTAIFSFPINNGPNQKWFVTYLTNTDHYIFVNVSSGNFMSSVQTNKNVYPPFKTLQSNDVKDLWTITKGSEEGAYFIKSVSVVNPEGNPYVVDLAYGYPAPPAPRNPVIIQTNNGNDSRNQQWLFVKEG